MSSLLKILIRYDVPVLNFNVNMCNKSSTALQVKVMVCFRLKR